MKKGKTLLIGITGLLLGVVLVLGLHGKKTLALFSDQDLVINTGTAGSVRVDVTEEVDGLSKSNISVTNTGDSACYVRMRVVMPNEEVVQGQLSVDKGSAKWQKGADGYFYYAEPVASGGKTENLYNSITYKSIPEGVNISQLKIIIYSEALQSAYVDISGMKDCVNDAERAFRHLGE